MFALLYNYGILALFMLAINYLIVYILLSKSCEKFFCQQWINVQ